ncbi:RICIN domain-containing protein [Carboxylicivirga linearis]|uniref:RICIN domain-containing protein n=1 Tax=Carboxylicivirga linearis TaxID=1628157 RepID=A0ABS5JW40_9BACT|nr:RICIN domain-containing protein [Carboxylicivirga linearis]MBS2099005.1 RICIN domain-containing protein [Carboxylicivirga linearis]
MKKNVWYSHLFLMGVISLITVFSSCEKEGVTPELEPEVTPKLKSTIIEGDYVLFNRNSNLAADLNVNTGDITQYSYWGGSNQHWRITAVGGGYYKISPLSDLNLAMDIAAQSMDDGANLQTYSYWGGYNQQFLLNDLGNGYYSIINRNSGKALDVYQASTANSANINQWSYWGGANQQWRLEPLSNGGNANGQLSWRLTSSGVPSDVLARITAAMDAAVARYNSWGDWAPRTLTVEYNTGVPTADGNINGNIRFGANSSYQNERTALHEIAHTYGVGTSGAWSYPLIDNYLFVGSNAVEKIEQFDGSGATISTGGSHFWPYGLNYNDEWSIINANRHVQIVYAMCQDGLYSGY